MRAANPAALAATFARAARCYWLSVFPLIHREARGWQTRARAIPDAQLRHHALLTQQQKWGNIEGASAFATFLPPASRARVVRAISAWQAAYDYADTLSEQPSKDQAADSYQLHLTLRAALEPDTAHLDYYAHHPNNDDNGYLQQLVDICRDALSALPSSRTVGPPLRLAAIRIATYQSLNHGGQLSHENLEQWAKTQASSAPGVQWWETVAACASSLAALAFIAAAARPTLTAQDIASIEQAYYPWICALHTLLDSLVDYPEDIAAGQPSLITPYGSSQAMAIGMERLAEQSARHARRLPTGTEHHLLLVAMTCLYLCTPEASLPHARAATRRILKTLGPLAIPTILITRTQRLLHDPTRNVKGKTSGIATSGHAT